MSEPSSCLKELLLSVFGYESLPADHPSRYPTALLSSCISQEDVASLLSKTSCSLQSKLQALTEAVDDADSGDLRQAQLLVLAVACFRIFRTENACSFATEQPGDPFHALTNQTQDYTSSTTWALQQLSADGEDVLGPIKAPQYLVAALTLLSKPFGLDVLGAEAATARQCTATTLGGPAATLGSSKEERAIQSSIMAVEAANPGMAAWAARAVMCQQRLLARPSLSLQRALVHLLAAATSPMPESALRSAAAAVSSAGQEPPAQPAVTAALSAAMEIESSLAWLEYRHVSTASEHAAQALRDLCMHLSTEGALGKRTETQQTSKAQLVLRVDWQMEGDGDATQKRHKGILEGCSWPGFPAQEVWPQAEQQKGSAWEGWVDDSGVRHVPQLHNGAEKVLVLAPLEQAAVLAHTTLQRKGKARSESIADWIIAPGVEALLMQQCTVFAVAACTLLLRIRHELERPRVRERALLALQALYDFLKEMPLPSDQIEPLLYTTPMPLHSDVRAEMAAVWVKAGMMGQAMSEYESLGRWERLVDCYMFCGKAAAAESVLSERLKVDGENPQLLCAMGKLLRQDEWFERAWQASKCTHAGSQRELARSALSRTAYEAAADHFTLALSRNPLDAESWFGLGFCELKRGEERAGHAAVAFTRCVQADGSHGEAWNNLGALHVAAGRYGPAFKALSVSIKLCQRTWQISDNYAVAAMHCKEFSTAAKASVEATKLSNGTHVNTRVLEALVSRVESRRGCKSHVHDKDASASQSMQTAGLNVGSERNAELDTCRAEEEEGGQEDRDEYMREEAGRLLAALSTLDTTLVDAPVGTPDESVGDSANELHDADAESRQRTFLEEDVRKALDAACSASNVPAQALGQLCRFHRCTGDVSAAKEAGFKWLRASQAHGWQEDEASVADVAACCESLYMLHLDGVSTSEIDASDLKKWWSPLRLQVSAAARTVAHTLGEDNNVALQLKQIVEKILAQTQ